jgi:hypothetical protein
VAREHPLEVGLPQGAVLDDRLDPDGVERLVRGVVVGGLVVG